jgi:TorA maturation chaperone TorD
MQEQSAERSGRDAEPFRSAARDFLSRHLGAWLPIFCRRLEATDTAYAPYGAILADLLETHRDRLGSQPQDAGDVQ